MNVKKLFYIQSFISSLLFLGPIIILFFLEFINYTQLGIIFAVSVISSLLFELPSGILADLYGNKKVIILGYFLAAAEITTIALGKNFSWFLLASIIGGVGNSMISGADMSLLMKNIKEKDFKKTFGKIKTFRYLAIVIAALIGAPLFAINVSLPLLLSTISVILAIFVILKIPEAKQKKSRSYSSHFFDSLKESWKNKKLFNFLMFYVFSGGSIWIFHDLLRSPYYKLVGFPIATLGIITAVITLSRILISINAERIEEKLGEKNSIKLLLFLPIVLLLGLAFIPNKLAVLVAIIMYGVWSYQEVVANAYSQKHMNNKQRATLTSIQSFYNSIMIILGALLIGWISNNYGLVTAIQTLAFLGLIGGGFVFLRLRKML